MPASYHIDPEHSLVTVRVWGAVDGSLVETTARDLVADPQWSASYDRLWDCREITQLVLTLEDVRALVEKVQQNLTGTPSGAGAPRIVIVVERDTDRGIALLARFMMRDRVVEVFSDIEAAHRFLHQAPR